MLANTRFCFLLTLLLALPFAVEVPSAAQVMGVPPSVTSLGFGGLNNPTPGVRASVTSLGPNGYTGMPLVGNFGNCCANFFFPYGHPTFGTPPLASGRHHHRHHDGDQGLGPIVEPVYVPYAVPYAADQDEDDAADYQDSADREPVSSRPVGRQLAAKGSAGSKSSHDFDPGPENDSGRDSGPVAESPAYPVAVQPTTVLIFKDGHRSDVVNYAIVGDTLFDFAGGRAHKILLADIDLDATRKANDDQGIEFKVPHSSGKGSGASH
jgi:hypothetical protein